MALRRKDPVRSRSKGAAGHQAPSWQAWRIADGRFDPLSPMGASLVGGRWNSPGLGVIDGSCSYAGAMLECLAHAGIGRVPRTHVAVEIAISEAVAVERRDESDLPAGWDRADLRVARAFGDAWIREQSTALLGAQDRSSRGAERFMTLSLAAVQIASVMQQSRANLVANPQH